jgi:hypothetical protein
MQFHDMFKPQHLLNPFPYRQIIYSFKKAITLYKQKYYRMAHPIHL